MSRYLVHSLAAAHPDLGRDGAICPYAAGAVRRDLFRLAVSPLDRLDAAALGDAMGGLRAAYETLAAETPPRDRLYCAAVLAFPHLPEGGAALVERAQRAAKPDFVRDGRMIGEFYPGCAAPGLHNARFRPFDTPVVALAVRAMTAQDAPFMAGDPDFEASYARRFGALPTARARSG